MSLRIAAALLAALGSGTLAAPLQAQDQAQDQAKPAKDPNERVCQNQPVLGSRLATRRICATRAEWEEYRRLDREAIDQTQRSPCMKRAGC